MRGHIRYFLYLLGHKYSVMLKCFSVGLYWRGLAHDLSKFLPSEFFPYSRHFYNPDGSVRRTDPGRHDDPAFDRAQLRHYNRNRHHWQWWILCCNEGQAWAMPMDVKSRLEMLVDWRVIGERRGRENDIGWYEENRDKLMFHPSTRSWVECVLTTFN